MFIADNEEFSGRGSVDFGSNNDEETTTPAIVQIGEPENIVHVGVSQQIGDLITGRDISAQKAYIILHWTALKRDEKRSIFKIFVLTETRTLFSGFISKEENSAHLLHDCTPNFSFFSAIITQRLLLMLDHA